MNYPFVPDGVAVHTVSQINDEVRKLLEQGFAAIWVEGEISNLARPPSGHIYFKLKDNNAVLSAVLLRSQGMRLAAGFEPRDGIKVVACGRISVYSPRGEYQFMVERLFPKGIGAMELALKQLKEKLQLRGYFDPKRKKPLPLYPRCICLIASPTGAAVRDMIEILGQRWPATPIVVRPSRVQGEGAAEDVAAAIIQINRVKANRRIPVDVIILGRGGGSVEDLWAFNQEIVADAIFRSKIPVVSAIGHEIDVTVADLVADVRASTPSHAAELIVPNRIEMLDQVREIGGRMLMATQRRCQQGRRRLDDLAGRRALRSPVDRLHDLERRLDDWGGRLTRAIRIRAVQAKQTLESAASRLETLSPLNVLARGYSLTRTESSPAILRSADQVQPGERIVTMLQHGQIISRVETIDLAPGRQG
jgi:exodeoxyribonuclease VII large subunit